MITTIADSISLCILDNCTILTGVGNELHVHTKDTNRVCTRLPTKIHGIVKGAGDRVLIYGDRNFAILQWNNNAVHDEPELLYKGACHYWISNVRFLPRTDKEEEFLLLGATCVAARFRCGPHGQYERVESSGCSDKCLLYCSHLIGDSWQDLTVFGGNAFGELLIWQPHGLQSPILGRHQMHNGVIFSIDYDEASQTLITTSDDRSIRFWHVQIADGNWQTADLKALASGYGHTARVFKGKLVKYDNRLYAITVGEDSHFCVWHTNGELLYKRRQHFGAIIWNCDFHLSTLYTVSSTGNLMAYDLGDVLDAAQSANTSNALTIGYDQGEPGEYVAKIKFLANDKIIGITSKNQLVHANDVATEFQWHLFTACDNYKATVLETHKNRFAVCGYKRYTLYECASHEIRKVREISALSGIIRSFHFLHDHAHILSDDQGNCVLQLDENVSFRIELPKSKEPWLTAALLIDTALLLLSNRQGNLLLYQKETAQYRLSDVLKHPHGHLGATQLQLISSNAAEAFVKSAGHDGALRTLRICKLTGRLRICSREVIPVAWVESMVQHGDDELLLGFNDNHFVAWSRERDFLMQTPCGGGHRCWDYSLDAKGLLKLLFIRNKTVVREHKLLTTTTTTTTTPHIRMPPRNKWHVKPCNVMALIADVRNDDNILVTAGDDNLIKLSVHHKQTRTIMQKAEIHAHISNVRALKVVNDVENECLIFSGGGRAQLCVTQFDRQTFRLTELLSFTLNGGAGGTPNANSISTHGYSFNPETRIMCCDVLRLSHNAGFHIFLGCSDGFLRKLHLTSDHRVSVVKQLFYGRCILQVRLIAGEYLLTAATDGRLRLYDLDLCELMAQQRLVHHSSGVNALDVRLECNDTQLHILSGGDDETVTYTLFDLRRKAVVRTKCLAGLHTAQVTGARLCGGSGADLYSVTSGVDQTVIKYNLTKDCVACVFVGCVADVKGLCVDDKQWCHVYGCGLQIFQFGS